MIRQILRASRRLSALTTLAAMFTLISGGTALSKVEGTRLISSGAASVSFEISIPPVRLQEVEGGASKLTIRGFGSFSPEGAIEFPGRTYLVAIPLTGRATISYEVIEIEDLDVSNPFRVPGKRLIPGEDDIPVTEFYDAPDPWDGRSMLETVKAGDPSFMGRVRVLPLQVNPVSISGEDFIAARRIRVIVNFEESPLRDPSSSDGLFGDNRIPVSSRWQDIYDQMLVNPSDVPQRAKPVGGRRPEMAPAELGRKLKIRIPETGVYSIRADSLIAAGLSPSLSNTGFALRKYYFDENEQGLTRKVDVPYHVVKGSLSPSTIFSADDLLVFYTLGLKDDSDAGDLDATFTDDCVIWLEEDVAGVLMAEGTLPALSGLSVTGFEARHIERKDTWFENNINAGTTDFYFLQAPVSSEAAMPFIVNDPASAGVFSLTVRLMGLERLVLHQFLTFSLRNSSGTFHIADDEVPGTSNKTFEFTGLPASWLVDGENELLISSDQTWGFTVNDFEIVYPAGFNSRDDMLEFELESSLPPQEVHITGLSVAEGYLLDITDPLGPVFYSLPGGWFNDDITSWSVDIGLQVGSESRFVMLGRGAGASVPVSKMGVDAPSSLIASSGPYDALVISHSNFLPPQMQELAEYVQWREQQGYRLLTADVADVYDEFNGGLPSCEAIKRFVQYGFDNWGVEFVLLVGDGSEDHKRIFDGDRGSGPDFVPPFTFSVDVIGNSYDDEVVAADKYYAYLDETWPSSGYPDLFVGRLPVGEGVELRALLNKIRQYEDAGGDLSWRRRVALFADDAWSDYPNYRYKPGELHFEQGMSRIAGFIEESLPGGFDVQRLFLSQWTDSIHEPGDSGVQVFSDATAETRSKFTPYLLQSLNEGALFFSFQGHAHRAHLSSESGFSMFSQYRDLNRLTSARNFVFFGAGCHISQFAFMSEFGRLTDGPNGDCITEQMLFRSVSGAVSTYASTGFEVLDQNEYFFDRLHTFIFQTPPVDSIPPGPGGTGAHWVFGKLITMAEIEHIGAAYYGFDQTYRYLILGDPMLDIDPGPPLMTFEADWGEGFSVIESDTLRSGNSSNTGTLRFTASDVVSLGGITLDIDGEDRTGDLTLERIGDPSLTWPRSWEARFDYTVSLDDHSLVFSALSPGGDLLGSSELTIGIGVRLFYGEGNEVLPGGEVPSRSEFRILVDLPIVLDQPPVLKLDGVEFTDASLAVPQGSDSVFWEAVFDGDFTAGTHTFTVNVGQHEADLVFMVGGSGLLVESYSFPNPFSEGTNICFTLNFPADSGSISIYNVSGRLIRTIPVPFDMLGEATSMDQPNLVYWDGRDLAGDRVANGSYIVLLDIQKDGQSTRLQSISVKLE